MEMKHPNTDGEGGRTRPSVFHKSVECGPDDLIVADRLREKIIVREVPIYGSQICRHCDIGPQIHLQRSLTASTRTALSDG